MTPAVVTLCRSFQACVICSEALTRSTVSGQRLADRINVLPLGLEGG